MSKNLTRKGLAFGAMVALASSVFAGAPAQAAPGTGQLSLTPSSGTEWIVPSKNVFSVKVNYLAGYTNSQAAKLKLKITTAGGFQVNTDAASTTLATAIAGVTDSTVASTATSGNLTLGADNVFAGLAIDSALATTSYSVGIQAWEDSDLDGVIDSGEWTSNSETVSFTKNSDITWTLAVDALVVGGTTAAAKVTSNANLSQLTWNTGASSAATNGVVQFSDDTATAGTYVAATAVGISYNATDNRLEATSAAFGSSATLAAGDKVKAGFFFDNTARELATSTTGWSAKITAAADYGVAIKEQINTAAALTISAVGTATVTASAATVQSSTNAKVLTGTTSVTVTSKVTAVSGAAKSGVSVKFAFAETAVASLAAAATVTSGAVVLQNTNAGVTQSKDVTAVTDADGIATVTFTLAGLVAGNTFIVTPSSQGLSTTGTTFTVEDETIGSIVNLNAIGGNTATEELVFAKDANFDLQFAVLNQFGKGLTGSAYSVSVNESSTTVYGSVVNGVATVNFPKYTTVGARDLTAQGVKNGVNAGSSITLEVTIGAASTPAALTLTNGGYTSGTGSEADFGATDAIALNTSAAFVNADTRKGATAGTTTANEYVVVAGVVTDATGAVALTTVTLSGTGLDFEADGVFAKDSITVTTSETGAYDVKVRSSLGGSKTVTVTSGSVTKTQVIKFASAADTAGATLTVSANADSVVPGASIRFTGKLVDKFGNPVAVTHAAGTKTFTITYAGPGFVSTIPTSTDATGAFAVNVLTGTGDSGTATLTVTYDADASGTTYAAVTASKVVTLTAPAEAAATITGSTKKITFTIDNAKGELVQIKVGNKTVKTFTAYSKAHAFGIKAAKGSAAVKVYVAGDLVAAKTVSVK